MNEAIKIYKQIKKQEKKWETAGIVEKNRIMKKVLILKRRLDRLAPPSKEV